MRPKWDERHGGQTYGAGTVAKAANGTGAAPTLADRFSLTELLARPDLLTPPVPVAWKLGWAGYSTMLAAREKRGKSTLFCHIAADRSRQGGTVLLIWLEEALANVVRRLADLGAIGERVHVVQKLLGSTAVARAWEIRAHADAVNADTVLLDSFIRFGEGIVEDARLSTDVHPVTQALTDIAHESNCALIFSHHSKKDGSGYRDSSAIGAAVDAIAEMSEPDPIGDPTRRHVKLVARFPVEDFEYRYRDGAIALVAPEDIVPVDTKVFDVIKAQPGISAKKLREAVGGNAKTTDTAVKRLLSRGIVADRGSEHRHQYHVPDASQESLNLLQDKAGQGVAVRQNEAEPASASASKSLQDKAGQGLDTPTDTPNQVTVVRLSTAYRAGQPTDTMLENAP
jgi:hypothetical protein